MCVAICAQAQCFLGSEGFVRFVVWPGWSWVGLCHVHVCTRTKTRTYTPTHTHTHAHTPTHPPTQQPPTKLGPWVHIKEVTLKGSCNGSWKVIYKDLRHVLGRGSCQGFHIREGFLEGHSKKGTHKVLSRQTHAPVTNPLTPRPCLT